MINSRDINDLTLEAKLKCLQFLNECELAEIDVKIIQTLRDEEYQASLYAIGRTIPGKKVTNCDGKRKKSYHQTGKAWDAVPLTNGKIDWDDKESFKKMAEIAKKLGITAGYYFKGLPDSPHFQI